MTIFSLCECLYSLSIKIVYLISNSITILVYSELYYLSFGKSKILLTKVPIVYSMFPKFFKEILNFKSITILL